MLLGLLLGWLLPGLTLSVFQSQDPVCNYGAYVFNGTDETLGSVCSNSLSAFSLAVTVKWTGTGIPVARFVKFTSDTSNGIEIGFDDTGLAEPILVLTWHNSGSDEDHVNIVETTIPKSTRTRILVNLQANGAYTLFVEGVETKSGSFPSPTITNTARTPTFGAVGWEGVVTDLYVYDNPSTTWAIANTLIRDHICQISGRSLFTTGVPAETTTCADFGTTEFSIAFTVKWVDGPTSSDNTLLLFDPTCGCDSWIRIQHPADNVLRVSGGDDTGWSRNIDTNFVKGVQKRYIVSIGDGQLAVSIDNAQTVYSFPGIATPEETRRTVEVGPSNTAWVGGVTDIRVYRFYEVSWSVAGTTTQSPVCTHAGGTYTGSDLTIVSCGTTFASSALSVALSLAWASLPASPSTNLLNLRLGSGPQVVIRHTGASELKLVVKVCGNNFDQVMDSNFGSSETHVLVTVLSGQRVAAYVNGVPTLDTSLVAGTCVVENTWQLAVGPTQEWDGDVTNVRVWDTADITYESAGLPTATSTTSSSATSTTTFGQFPVSSTTTSSSATSTTTSFGPLHFEPGGFFVGGTDPVVNYGTLPAFGGSAGFSIAFTLKLTNIGAGSGQFIRWWQGATFGDDDMHMQIAGGTPTLSIQGRVGSQGFHFSLVSVAVNEERTYMVSIGDGTLTCWADGALLNSPPFLWDSVNLLARSLQVGFGTDGGVSPFAGSITNIYLFPRALSTWEEAQFPVATTTTTSTTSSSATQTTSTETTSTVTTTTIVPIFFQAGGDFPAGQVVEYGAMPAAFGGVTGFSFAFTVRLTDVGDDPVTGFFSFWEGTGSRDINVRTRPSEALQMHVHVPGGQYLNTIGTLPVGVEKTFLVSLGGGTWAAWEDGVQVLLKDAFPTNLVPDYVRDLRIGAAGTFAGSITNVYLWTKALSSWEDSGLVIQTSTTTSTTSTSVTTPRLPTGDCEFPGGEITDNDVFNYTSDCAIVLSGAFTISFNIRVDTATYAIAWSLYVPGDPADPDKEITFAVHWAPGSDWIFWSEQSPNVRASLLVPGGQLGVEYRMTCSISEDGTMRVWRDGILLQTGGDASAVPVSSARTLVFGRGGYIHDPNMLGSLTNIKIWNSEPCDHYLITCPTTTTTTSTSTLSFTATTSKTTSTSSTSSSLTSTSSTSVSSSTTSTGTTSTSTTSITSSSTTSASTSTTFSTTATTTTTTSITATTTSTTSTTATSTTATSTSTTVEVTTIPGTTPGPAAAAIAAVEAAVDTALQNGLTDGETATVVTPLGTVTVFSLGALANNTGAVEVEGGSKVAASATLLDALPDGAVVSMLGFAGGRSNASGPDPFAGVGGGSLASPTVDISVCTVEGCISVTLVEPLIFRLPDPPEGAATPGEKACAFVSTSATGELTWSTKGVTRATPEQVRAIGEDPNDGIWCSTTHLSIFGAIFSVVLACTNLELFSEDGFRAFYDNEGWYTSNATGITLFVLGLLLGVAILADVVECWRFRSGRTHEPWKHMKLCSNCLAWGPQLLKHRFAVFVVYARDVIQCFTAGKSKMRNASLLSAVQRFLAAQTHISVACVSSHCWNGAGWLESKASLPHAVVRHKLQFHAHVAEDVIERYLSGLSICKVLLRFITTCWAVHPLVDSTRLGHSSVTVHKRTALQLAGIVGVVATNAMIFNFSGEFRSWEAPVTCPIPPSSYWFIPVATVVSISINAIPNAFLMDVAKQVHGRPVGVAIFWFLYLIYASVGLLLLSALLANLNAKEQDKWYSALEWSMSFKLFGMPMAQGLRHWLMLEIFLHEDRHSKISHFNTSMGFKHPEEIQVSEEGKEAAELMAKSAISLEELLTFAALLGDKVMPEFKPDTTTSEEVLMKAIRPLCIEGSQVDHALFVEVVELYGLDMPQTNNKNHKLGCSVLHMGDKIRGHRLCLLEKSSSEMTLSTEEDNMLRYQWNFEARLDRMNLEHAIGFAVTERKQILGIAWLPMEEVVKGKGYNGELRLQPPGQETAERGKSFCEPAQACVVPSHDILTGSRGLNSEHKLNISELTRLVVRVQMPDACLQSLALRELRRVKELRPEHPSELPEGDAVNIRRNLLKMGLDAVSEGQAQVISRPFCEPVSQLLDNNSSDSGGSSKHHVAPKRIVVHSWQGMFSHLVAMVTSDALQMEGGYKVVHDLVLKSDYHTLLDLLVEKGCQGSRYWIDLFALDPSNFQEESKPHVPNPWHEGLLSSLPTIFRDIRRNSCDQMVADLDENQQVPTVPLVQLLILDRKFHFMHESNCLAEMMLAKSMRIRQRLVLHPTHLVEGSGLGEELNRLADELNGAFREKELPWTTPFLEDRQAVYDTVKDLAIAGVKDTRKDEESTWKELSMTNVAATVGGLQHGQTSVFGRISRDGGDRGGGADDLGAMDGQDGDVDID